MDAEVEGVIDQVNVELFPIFLTYRNPIKEGHQIKPGLAGGIFDIVAVDFDFNPETIFSAASRITGSRLTVRKGSGAVDAVEEIPEHDVVADEDRRLIAFGNKFVDQISIRCERKDRVQVAGVITALLNLDVDAEHSIRLGAMRGEDERLRLQDPEAGIV